MAEPTPGPSFRPVAALLTLLAAGAYFMAIHVLVVDAEHPRLLLALVFAPWVFALLSRARSHGAAAVALAIVAVAAAAWAIDAGLAARIELALLVETLAFQLAIAALFASSLRPGREALVTRLARMARGGHLPAVAVPYTRKVTAAWALFFVSIALASCALFATVPVAWWSLFVNLLVWPLVAAMFAVEYLVRRRVLSQLDHVSPLAGVTAFSRRRAAPPPEPRT